MDLKDYIFKMNVKTKVLSAFIILVSVSYPLYNFLILPLLDQQKRSKISLISQKKLLETKLASVMKMDTLEAELNKKKEELKNIESRFLKEEGLPSFFAELRSIAADNNIDILNLKVGEKQLLEKDLGKEFDKYEKLPVDISLVGNYLDTISFLAQLRDRPPLFNIAKIAVSAENEKRESVKTDFQLTLYLIIHE